MNFSRRQVIIAAVSTAAFTPRQFESAGGVSAPALASMAIFPGSINRIPLTFFNSDFSTQTTWRVINSIKLARVPALVEAEVQIVYDNRVLSFGDVLLIASRQTVHIVQAKSNSIEGTSTSVVYQLPVTDIVTADGLVEISLPVSTVALYPLDNVNRAQIPLISLKFVDSTKAARTFTQPLADSSVIANVTPWAAEVDVSWGTAGTVAATAGVYRAPTTVLVKSVGPHEVPAGLDVAISISAGCALTPTITGVAKTGGEMLEGAARISTLTGDTRDRYLLHFDQPIPAGEERFVSLTYPSYQIADGAVAAASASFVAVDTVGTRMSPRRLMGTQENKTDQIQGSSVLNSDITRVGG